MTSPSSTGRNWLPGRKTHRGPGTEPPFDPTSWGGALIVMLVAAAALWVVQIVNSAQHYSLNRFGLRPRHVDGLWGVLTQPFLHQSYGQLLSDTVTLVLIGWALLLSGVRTWLTVTAIVLVVGGLLTWSVAPAGPHGAALVGSSALVFGWLGYLLARAFFSRKLKWIAVAVIVLFFFGGLLSSVLPSYGSHSSWQNHLCGFVAGILAGAALHPRRAKPRKVTTPAVS